MTPYSEIYNACGIFETWHEKKFEDYTDPYFRQIIMNYVDEDFEKNVLLYGNNGAGKTMLMNIAFKELIHKQKEVYIIDFRNLVREYIKSWRGESKIPKIMSVDYLGIDDLGKEFSAGDVSKELAVTALDYVLRYRFQRMKPVWMTFNLTLKEIEPTYGKSIYSLLLRSSEAVCFDGEDYMKGKLKVIKKC